MRSRPSLASLLLCLLAGAHLAPAQAQYRVVGPDGKVTYTDVPQAGATGSRPSADTAASANSLPAELRQPASRFPVTLYASKDCSPCDTGRQWLKKRGVPFTEKRVESAADIQALRQLSGATNLPLLTIGQQQIKGLNTADWQSYLDAAGYPKESRLPANWSYPAPVALAPAAPTPAPTTPGGTAEPSRDSAPATAPADPAQPKIRF